MCRCGRILRGNIPAGADSSANGCTAPYSGKGDHLMKQKSYRKRRILGKCVSVLVSLLLACGCLGGTVGADSRTREDNWLQLSGNTTGARYIVSTEGEPFRLFGMARSQYCEPVDETPMYGEIRELCAHFKELGCNAIRLAVGVNKMAYPQEDFIEECGGYNEDGINRFIDKYVAPDVQGIIDSGMYVVLDLHEYPKGNPVTDPDPAKLLQYAREHYIPVWKELARRYKDEPMVAMYELWNEPYAADQGTLKLTGSGRIAEGTYRGYDWNGGVRDFYLECIKEVRKIDQKHMILVSDWNAGWGSAWAGTWGNYLDQLDDQVLFSAHAAKDHLLNFSMENYWADTAANNNICIQFGEVETEEWMATEQSMKDFVTMLERRKDTHQYNAFLWRPHNTPNNRYDYAEVWSDFAKGYASKPLYDTTGTMGDYVPSEPENSGPPDSASSTSGNTGEESRPGSRPDASSGIESPKDSDSGGMPVWLVVVCAVGGMLVLAGGVLAILIVKERKRGAGGGKKTHG